MGEDGANKRVHLSQRKVHLSACHCYLLILNIKKKSQEVNGALTVLKEVLDGLNMTMARTVFSDPVVVYPVRNLPAVAQFTL